MSRRGVLAAGAAFAGSVTAARSAGAQDAYPSRLIRLVCPFPAGSATDTQARFLAEQVGKTIGQKLIVENKAGATGNLAAADVARSAPDGYSLLLATNSSHAANIHLYKKLPFDPVADFTPIARLTRNPLVLVVAEGSPAKTLKELVALAKSQPGKLSFGTGNTGSLAAAQLLKSSAGIDIQRVPYQGTPQAITDLLGGRIDLVITDVAVVREFVSTGKLRALAVTTAAALKTMPGVPTMAEAGVPGYEFAAWSGLYGPAGLPAPIVKVLHDDFVAALKGPEADRFFDTVGLEPDPGTPDQLRANQAKQTELWGRIIAETGLEKT
jgi:tripartite-type tricarboxylate transporter receptor subunit TctC